MEETRVAMGIQEWLATFAFSRPVRHAARDFSDAVLMAELLSQVLPPGAVTLYNYPSTGQIQRKLTNWDLLNRKVLSPMKCEISRAMQDDLAHATPGAIALLLIQVKKTLELQARCSPRSLRSTNEGTKRVSTVKDPTSPVGSSKQQGYTTFPGSKPPIQPRSSSIVKCESPTRQSSDRVRSPASKKPSYSLGDVLPLPTDRPTPEMMESTFKKVLTMTKSPLKTGQQTSPMKQASRPPSPTTSRIVEGLYTIEEVTSHRGRKIPLDNAASAKSAPQALQLNIDLSPRPSARHVWPATPPTRGSSNSPGDYSTSALTRIQCTEICMEIPLQISPTKIDAALPRQITELGVNQIQLELCPSPTTFPRIQVPVENILNKLPEKFVYRPRRSSQSSPRTTL